MTRVSVKAEILKWAYERSDNQERLQKKYRMLEKWLTGELLPTINQLQDFANDTHTPLGYFFLDNPPSDSLPIPHYRTVEPGDKVKPSPNLIETIHIMKRRQDFMREYYEQYIGERLSFIGTAKGLTPKEIANRIRQLLRLEENWADTFQTFHDALRYLINKCESQRITVMLNGIVENNTHRPLNVSEFRGFVLVDDVAPLIFINGADSKSAQVFTLIHEIAHLLLGSSAVIEASPLNNNDESIETVCNSAAAEMLCPDETFRYVWNTHYPDGYVYETLSKIFKVSPIVIGRRAVELNCVSAEEFFDFYHDYMNQLKKIQEQKGVKSGGDFYNTTRSRLGDIFSNAVIYQAITGNIQYTDAYKLTGLNNKTFHNYINHIKKRGVL